MLVIGLLDMIVGFGLAGLSTQLKKKIDRIELCAAACFVSGGVVVGAALQSVC